MIQYISMSIHDVRILLRSYILTLVFGMGLVVGGVFTHLYLSLSATNARLVQLSTDLASTTLALGVTSNALAMLHSETTDISQTLTNTKDDVAAANSSITAVQSQVGGVQQAVGSISGSVSNLQKLATTDQELLAKYSKVYFLNENYAPMHLAKIPQDVVYSNTREEVFITEALPHLQKMLATAKSAGVNFYVASAYRSFSRQQQIKSDYAVTYGEGTANTFSADQGYSEHQLGTTADFIKSGSGGELSEDFENSDAFTWLTQNAYKYGFTLSYPKGNSHYVYEPWHWRFVGVKLATHLHNNNKGFYDLDQRDIDTYLANLFD